MLASAETKNMPGMLFHALNRAHMNAVQTELHERGLTDLGSPLILFILDHHGDHGEIASQRELAQTLRVSQAAIATSLKSMERLGYVEKRLDDQDNRRNRIAITEKGTAALKQCCEVFAQVSERMMKGLSPQEKDVLDQLLRRMLDNLGALKNREKGGCCPCCEN